MSRFLLRMSRMLFIVTFAGVTAYAGDKPTAALPNPVLDAPIAATKREQTAVLAGGCLWGVQPEFQHVKGVITATSGNSRSRAKTAEYELVSTGEPGRTATAQN